MRVLATRRLRARGAGPSVALGAGFLDGIKNDRFWMRTTFDRIEPLLKKIFAMVHLPLRNNPNPDPRAKTPGAFLYHANARLRKSSPSCSRRRASRGFCLWCNLPPPSHRCLDARLREHDGHRDGSKFLFVATQAPKRLTHNGTTNNPAASETVQATWLDSHSSQAPDTGLFGRGLQLLLVQLAQNSWQKLGQIFGQQPRAKAHGCCAMQPYRCGSGKKGIHALR